MKITWAFVFLMISATAQDRMAESLRKGIVEEESKHNLNAAIQNYQTVVSQFDEVRQTAATALFRMAESYRKLGKDEQAMAAYNRIAQEFADQSKLAEQSRSILVNTYHVAATGATLSRAQEQARQAYRNTLLEEISLIEKKLRDIQAQLKFGARGPGDVDAARIELIQAQRQLAAFDAGMSPNVAGRK